MPVGLSTVANGCHHLGDYADGSWPQGGKVSMTPGKREASPDNLKF